MTNSDLSPDFAAENVVPSPDFAAEWKLIDEDRESETACARRSADLALRIGQNLVKIRDALKPRGEWLAALDEHGMSQPNAWRYTTWAEMSELERDSEVRRQGSSFNLTAAVRKKKVAAPTSDHSTSNSPEPAISEDDRAAAVAWIDRQRKLAVEIVEAGVKALSDEQPSEYADDNARWANILREVAEVLLEIIGEDLEAELTKRLLPGAE